MRFPLASFVTTTKGVEGIDLRHNEECLIADSATDFAAAVIRWKLDKIASQAGDASIEAFAELYNPLREMLEKTGCL